MNLIDTINSFLFPGYIFSNTGFDVLFTTVLCIVLYHCISLWFHVRKQCLQMDRIAGFHLNSSGYEKLHWFKAHTEYFAADHEGLVRGVNRTTDFPGIYNFYLTAYLCFLHFYHPDVIQPVLTSSTPKEPYLYKYLEPWIGKGLLTANGKQWHTHRHLITPAFHFNILKSYVTIYNNCSKVLLNKWKLANHSSVEVFQDVNLLTLDVMMQCAMSSKTNCQDNKDSHPYIQNVIELSGTIVKRFSNPLYLISWIFYFSSMGRRFRKALKVVHSHTEKIIADRRRELETSCTSMTNLPEDELDYKGRELMDFIDILVKSKDEDGVGLSDREIRDEVDTFLFEGHDTTSSGLSWFLYNLAKHPEFQEKCRKEVIDVVGSKEDIEWADIPKLEYLTMCIKESLRLYPPVWMFARRLHEDLAIPSELNKSGKDIPKGTSVVIHIITLHRNPHLWENPNEFIPDRFLKENVARRPPYAYLPFSAGSRNCIGQNFAMNEMKVVIGQILRRFRLFLDEDTEEPIMDPMVILKSKNGIKVKLELL